jgi:hypothetical protein
MLIKPDHRELLGMFVAQIARNFSPKQYDIFNDV